MTSEESLLEDYREMLDECNAEVRIGYLTFSPSRVLEILDPIAFKVGFSEWLDSVGLEL